ncbi:MAG: glucose-1-phosphate thymidylyltransferase RfbA [Candidatus Omnitrophica bacterium]|jgi:glucose-1-phosphate thymidylyltransferase|nr:glucose-1-phosphate thymidylyltransferase RfbA [Candidatus Omnitrophota bacterium]
MKGIILAGGKATRLYPVTRAVCKQLLPVYDKPMVYYPLSVLMLAGVRDILLISTREDVPRFRDLLGDGSKLGINISYAVQDKPRGVAHSLIMGEDFIGKDSVCLILGDNVFYGDKLGDCLRSFSRLKKGAGIFGYYVKDPRQYGVIEFNNRNKVLSITEKPLKPKSNYAITGLYFFDSRAAGFAKSLKPSKRGELEITDVIKKYLKEGTLSLQLLGRGYAWLDTGTCNSLIDASMFIRTIEERQGLKVGCIEEIAYRMGFINKKSLLALADEVNTGYGEYLLKISDEEK